MPIFSFKKALYFLRFRASNGCVGWRRVDCSVLRMWAVKEFSGICSV